MEVSQHLLSSAIRFLTPAKDSVAFIPDVIRAVQERYRFWRVPSSLEEYSQASGAEFQTGIFNGQAIGQLRVYSNGLKCEASANTNRIDEFLDDLEGYVADTFGLWYQPMSPVARMYSSALEVYSDISLGRLDRLSDFNQRLTQMVAGYGANLSSYQLATISVHTDPTLASPIQPGRFIFERRNNVPYASNLYFSEAPVSTAQHEELLSLLEGALD